VPGPHCIFLPWRLGGARKVDAGGSTLGTRGGGWSLIHGDFPLAKQGHAAIADRSIAPGKTNRAGWKFNGRPTGRRLIRLNRTMPAGMPDSIPRSRQIPGSASWRYLTT